MSGSQAKIVPEINLDEFERRLRSAGASPSGAEDPLAELTRLVNMISRDGGKRDPVDEASRAPYAEGGGLSAGRQRRARRPFRIAREPTAGRRRGAGAPARAALGEAVRPPAGAAEELDLSAGVLAATRTAAWRGRSGKGAVALLALQDRGSGGDRRRAARRRVRR